DGADDLDRARPRADHTDALPGDRSAVIPARAVEAGSREVRDPRNLRIRRMVEHPGRGDDEIGVVGRSVGEPEAPAAALEGTTGALPAAADQRIDAPAPRDVLEVREYLAPRREAMRPFGIERERIAVEVRRDVAGEARIRVLAPGPAETVGLLVDDDVIAAHFSQPDCGEETGHPGPDDGEAERRSERQWLALTTRGNVLKRRTMRLSTRAGG